MALSRRALIGGGAVALAGLAARPSLAAIEMRDAALDAAAKGGIDAHACPGVQIAVAERGAMTASRGYGRANLETGTPVSPQSVFRIASLTKQFTAAAVLALSARGVLALDAPVSRHLPFMAKLKPVTALELMHQTAGLKSDEGIASPPADASGVKTQVRLAQAIAEQPAPFDFDPGTAWLYSNANYILLGGLIEAAAGKPLAEVMAELIFRPLGLTRTALDHAEDVVPGRASGYTPTGDNARPFANAAYIPIIEAGGAGAMRSSAEDLCRWHDALLGGRLLDAKHLDLMLAPGRLRDGRLSGANRLRKEDDAAYGDMQYACGLLVSPPGDARPLITHYGGINGFGSLLETRTDTRTTIAVLCNGDMGPDLPFRAIRRAVWPA